MSIGLGFASKPKTEPSVPAKESEAKQAPAQPWSKRPLKRRQNRRRPPRTLPASGETRCRTLHEKRAAASAAKTATTKKAAKSKSTPKALTASAKKSAKKVASAPAKTVKKKKVSAAKAPAKAKQKPIEIASIAPASAAKKTATPAVDTTDTKDTAPVNQPGSSKELYLNVKAAILVNMSTGQVYYEHNPDKTIAPASITKLLTLYLVREAMAQGKIASNTPIPVSSKAVTTGGSRMSLKRGEKVPLNELIKGISVVSANNACVAVAEYMGNGDPSKFVSEMNAKARKIGMTSSQFKNPNGLPASGQLSTARDIAKLSMSYLRTFPESLTVHSLTTHTYHGATHRNANSLLRTYQGVDGLKTGFVCASGYNITATAKRGNTRLRGRGAGRPELRHPPEGDSQAARLRIQARSHGRKPWQQGRSHGKPKV
jgi:D-alanyl-D-alanine carboxypeptidase